jgi:hypothetical protein
MKKVPFIATIQLFVVMFFTSCVYDRSEDLTHVARVGNTVLTRSEAERLILAYGSNSVPEKFIISQWVDREVLFQSALREDLDRDSLMNYKIEQYRKDVLGQAFLESIILQDDPISGASIKGYYEQNIHSYKRPADGARVFHFVYNSQAEAEAVARELLNPSSGFDRKTLFASNRVDAAVVYNGSLIKPLDDALFSSRNRSRILGPIQSRYGFHVIEVLDRFSAGSQIGLDEAYDEIYQRLLNHRIQLRTLQVLDSLKSKFHIEIAMENLK